MKKELWESRRGAWHKIKTDSTEYRPLSPPERGF